MSLRTVIDSGAKVSPPPWMRDNMIFETIMGSEAYGVSSDDSDRDVYGVCFPLKHLVFPHLGGEIIGFGNQLKRFDNWQEHHVMALGREWDFSVYSIVNYFQLAMQNNPNILDSLFTPRRCILSSTSIGELIRERRKDFLHKGSWHKLKGYAYAQLHKINTKSPDPNSKRAAGVAEIGYDRKYAYHVVRLLLEGEMILAEHDLDIERHREQLKSIRRGEWTQPQLIEWAAEKEKQLEGLYSSSTLRHTPDEPLIKRLLMDCLEQHYGDLSKSVIVEGDADRILRDIARLTAKYQ